MRSQALFVSGRVKRPVKCAAYDRSAVTLPRTGSKLTPRIS